MTTLTDPIFGQMTLQDSYWIKTETMTIYGKTKTVEVICDDCDGEIIEDQRNAYLQYKLQESSFVRVIGGCQTCL